MSKTRRRARVLIRPTRRFLVLTPKGLEFVEGWFDASGPVPPQVTKLYQLLLRAATMGGVISVQLALRMGYGRRVIEKAVSKAYAELTHVSKRPENEALRRIREMVGAPPREMYV